MDKGEKSKAAEWENEERSQYAGSYGCFSEGSWEAEEGVWQDIMELNKDKWKVPHLQRSISKSGPWVCVRELRITKLSQASMS